MWYLKEAAKKVGSATGAVYNYSKSVVLGPEEPENPTIALIEQLANCKDQVPTKRMDKLVAASYQIEQFEKISSYLREKLSKFRYTQEGVRRSMNMMVIVNYLIKHGASGFIDDFRSVLVIFKNYQLIKKQKVLQDERAQMQLEADVDELSQKARHIEMLLTDKNKLLKQKQLAMLIKQKLKLYEETQVSRMKQGYQGSKPTVSQEKGEKNSKKSLEERGARIPKDTRLNINDLMERYVWKYVDSLDDKIEQTTDKLLQKLDTYIEKVVEGKQPEKFGFDDDEPVLEQDIKDQSKSKKREEAQNQEQDVKAGYAQLEEKDDLLDKIEKEIDKIEIKEEDLLEFEEQNAPKKRDEKLIDLL